MGNQTGNYDVRIGTLEQDVKDLQTALATEKQDRLTAQAENEQVLRDLADLLSDNEDVIAYAIKYLNHIDAQYYAKELKLQEAIQTFNEFLKLPAKATKWTAYWDAAWAVAAATVPALRLTSFFSKLEKAAQIEIAASKAFMKTPKLVARVTATITRGHNIADVMYKANNVRDKVDKAVGISMVIPVDPSRSPVRDLIQESNTAHESLDTALDALTSEFKARLHSLLYKVPYNSTGTMMDMAKKLLPELPHFFGPDELEELGRYYLWTILSKWAAEKVTWMETQSVYGTDYHLDGLNDTQKDQLMDWYGISSNWHPHGVVPMVVFANLGMLLGAWRIKTVKRQSNIGIFGYG